MYVHAYIAEFGLQRCCFNSSIDAYCRFQVSSASLEAQTAGLQRLQSESHQVPNNLNICMGPNPSHNPIKPIKHDVLGRLEVPPGYLYALDGFLIST